MPILVNPYRFAVAGGATPPDGPTRLYFDVSTTNAVSPTFDAGWEVTTNATRGRMTVKKSDWVAFVEQANTSETSTTPDIDVLVRQFVSSPLDGAQTISGTVKGILLVAEGGTAAAGSDMRAQVKLYVVSGDGSTVRGTLLNYDTSGLSNEFDTTRTTRKFPLNWAGAGATLTSVDAQSGDRIVAEIGARSHNIVNTTATPRMEFGFATVLEWAENETGVGQSGATPWLEFSQSLAFEETFGIIARDMQTAEVNATPSTVAWGTVVNHWLALSVVGSKASSATRTVPTGFTGLASVTGGSGVAAAVDVGSMRLSVDYKECDGTETGTVSYAWSATPSPAIHGLLKYRRPFGAAGWSLAASSADDTTTGTGAASIAGTAATDPGFLAGDVVLVAYSNPTDAGTVSAPSITVPGCTISAVRELLNFDTTVGNDGGLYICEATILTGTSSGAPSFSATASATNEAAGPIAFIRLR